MSVLKEIPPTAGFQLYAKDFLRIFMPGGLRADLEKDFRDYLNLPYARITYSGTAALYLILESLKSRSARKTVVIPSFVCPLVPLAIHRAGFRVAVCDINTTDFSFDPAKLKTLCSDNKDILAIIAVHLAGIPIDFKGLKEATENTAIFIIEDCAQALGAVYENRKAGALGDFSFFSLCRGKGLTIYEGGVIAAKKESDSAIISDTIENIVNNDLLSESLKILELLGYWIFYRPQLFWWVYRLPQIFWNIRGQRLRALTEYFTVDFPLHKVSGVRKSIGHATFGRLENEIDKQRQKAHRYIKNLEGVKGIRLITERQATKATYPYITLLFSDPEKCRKAREIFNRSGLGVFQIYAMAISDYDYLKSIVDNADSLNARNFAQSHITLTTSAFLNDKDLNSITDIIKDI
jgi:perosamine synthetase